MDRKCLFAIFLIAFGLKMSIGQVLQFGTCPVVEPVKFFDLEKFLGKWYEIERFPTWYEEYGQCAYKTIQWCGTRIEIEHGFVRDEIQFILHVNSSYSPGDEAIFVIQENNIDPLGMPLTVIYTDYLNYAIVYGCKNSTAMDIKYISAWILSRETTLPEEMLLRAYDELNSIPYANTAYLETVTQADEKCQYRWTAHVQAEIQEELRKV